MSVRAQMSVQARASGLTASLLASLLFVAGCGGTSAPGPSSEGGTAPRPSLSGLSPIPRDGAGGGSTRVTLLLPNEPTGQMLFWKEAAQLDAAKGKAIFSVRNAAEGESVADLLRRATREGATALLVAVDDAESLAPALAEARDRGAKIVTVDQQVALEGTPVPAIVRPDYGPVADELVAAAMADAERLGKSAAGPALVLHVSNFPAGAARAQALVDAAERAGVTVIGGKPMVINGTQPETTAAVLETLKEHPDLAMLLTGDDLTFVGSVRARSEQPRGTGMSLAGFLVDPELFSFVRSSYASAAAFADERVLGIYGLRNVLSLIEGEPVDEVTIAPLPVRHATGPPQFGYMSMDMLPADSPTEDLKPLRGGPPSPPRGGEAASKNVDPS